MIVRCKQHTNELAYTLDVVLNCFLGVGYELVEYNNDLDGIELQLVGSESKLVINSTFWDVLSEKWLTEEMLPDFPLNIWNLEEEKLNVNLVNNNIPVLYGKAGLSRVENTLTLSLDVLGGVFFMLSRCEEIVSNKRDNHDRFSAETSIAFQSEFLNRPLVDEYVEILWSCILECWPSLKRKRRVAKTLISCDVDVPYSPAIKIPSALARQVVGDLLKRKSLTLALSSLINPVISMFKNYRFDSYDTFEWIMDVNEAAGNKVAFYFISDHSAGDIDGCYTFKESRIRNLIQRIHQRGHEIGLHGSYNTYQDIQQIKKEVNSLKTTMNELNINQEKIGCRQHFLRWKTPVTATYLNNAGLDYDTTLSFADRPGFRCGTCHEYPMYDLNNRKALHIIQRPLIVMESSIIASRFMDLGYSDEALEMFLSYKKICKQFDGNFTLLWHNSHFTTKNDKIFYKRLIK